MRQGIACHGTLRHSLELIFRGFRELFRASNGKRILHRSILPFFRGEVRIRTKVFKKEVDNINLLFSSLLYFSLSYQAESRLSFLKQVLILLKSVEIP